MGSSTNPSWSKKHTAVLLVCAGLSIGGSCGCTGSAASKHATSAQPAIYIMDKSETAAENDPSHGDKRSTSQDHQQNSEQDIALQHLVTATLEKVSRLRQLSPRMSVRASVIDRVTAAKQIQEQTRRDLPAEAIDAEAKWLAAFGFIPANYDYEAQVYRLLSSQVAGYYDPKADRMYLINDMSDTEQELTLSHELVHALQNQHFELGNKLQYQPGSGDKTAALHGLAEGDATSAMLDYALLPFGKQATNLSLLEIRLQLAASLLLDSEFRSFPRFLRDSLLAPYIDGIALVHELRKMQGWELVNKVWQDPPDTTEQVLHVDKLLAREPAVQVRISVGPSGDNWTLMQEETLGEQSLLIGLEEWMVRKAAQKAASGWGGDRSAVWKNASGHVVAAWHIVFDKATDERTKGGIIAEAEANEAMEALRDNWSLPQPNGACHRLADGRQIGAIQHGLSVVMVTEPVLTGEGLKKGGTARVSQKEESNGSVERCMKLLKWATRIGKES